MNSIRLVAYHSVFLPSLLPTLILPLTKTPANTKTVSHVLQWEKHRNLESDWN